MKTLLISLLLGLLCSTTMAQGLPDEVSRLVTAVASLPGVSEAQVEKTYLPDVKVSELSLPGAYADLPIAALRRSKGALPDELLLSINFRIRKDESGLKALEFLSWWTRDQSRGGENMQLRAIGLPPVIGKDRQLGHTLRFTIDWFYANPSQDMSKVLAAIAGKAKSLEAAADLYRSAF
jgi:hypothetical protein